MFDALRHFDPERWVITMIILIIAITIHEFAHAISADRLGDNTPRSQGRISLNPIDHLDPLGTVMMAISTAIGFGIGWGRPVLVQPGNFRNPRWNNLVVAIAGPASNVLQAIVFAIIFRVGLAQHWFSLDGPQTNFLFWAVMINISLAVFNMIPLGPLDGAKILSALLHPTQAVQYDNFMASWGTPLFLVLALTGALGYIILPPTMAIVGKLLG